MSLSMSSVYDSIHYLGRDSKAIAEKGIQWKIPNGYKPEQDKQIEVFLPEKSLIFNTHKYIVKTAVSAIRYDIANKKILESEVADKKSEISTFTCISPCYRRTWDR